MRYKVISEQLQDAVILPVLRVIERTGSILATASWSDFLRSSHSR